MSSPTPTNKQTPPPEPESPYKYMYGVFHTICAVFAIYLSFKCNGGFSFGSLLVACCCPYVYIIYTFATTSGLCGVLSSGQPSVQPNNMMPQYNMMPNYSMMPPNMMMPQYNMVPNYR